jgi:hypothetical protein
VGNSSKKPPGDKNDKTQLLSESMVLEVAPAKPTPPARPTPAQDKNDRSVWKGLVVGADEFAPPPPPRRSLGKWVVAGVLGAAAVGAGGYALYPNSATPAAPDARPKPDAAQADAARPDAPPLDAAPPADAAPPVDASVADATADAGVKPAPKKKPSTKKKPAPKPVPKKKPH